MHAISRLLTSCGIWIAATASVASPQDVTIDHAVTWMTGAQPEVHLLLRNETTQRIEFTLQLGRGTSGPISCKGSLRDVDPGFGQRFDRRIGISRILTSGTISPGGWAHRAYALGSSGLVPPCQVPYVVTFSGRRIEGAVEVPGDRPSWEGAEVTKSSLEALSVVEDDRRYSPGVISRLLVRNREAFPVYVLVSKRELDCGSGATGRLALHESLLQGEDVGPAVLPAHGWVGFVNAIEVPELDDASACRLRVELSALTPNGMKPVLTSEFSLHPTEVFDIPMVHRR